MRTKIREAIQQGINSTPTDKPIDFKTGFAIYLGDGSVPVTLPCAWLCPLELVKKEGRDEGLKTYSGLMYIIESVVGLAAEQKDEAWDRMERIALVALNNAMQSPDITLIDNIRCVPDELALTGYMTISVAVRFDIKVRYCE